VVPPAHLPLTRERLMQDLLELQSHLGVERAHFLGIAGGGYLPQRLAIARPERVLSILLFASKPGLKHSQAASWIPRIESQGLRSFLMETIATDFRPAMPTPRISPGSSKKSCATMLNSSSALSSR